MDGLIHGYQRFHAEVFPLKRELYARLADRQSPKYLFITCCDSRVNPVEFTDSEAGEMFSERSVGNIVPLPDSKQIESGASIEYAIRALRVQHIIICGHSNCGAMKALLNPAGLEGLPMVKAWVANAGITRESVVKKYPKLEGDDLLDATIRENVITQLDHLKHHPAVAQALEEGALDIHGWIFEVEQGRVLEYDKSSGCFIPLLEAHAAKLEDSETSRV